MRAALQLHHEHPEITLRRDALLCSINARLGALLPEGDAGGDFEPLSTLYLEELILFNQANVEDVEEQVDAGRQSDGG